MDQPGGDVGHLQGPVVDLAAVLLDVGVQLLVVAHGTIVGFRAGFKARGAWPQPSVSAALASRSRTLTNRSRWASQPSSFKCCSWPLTMPGCTPWRRAKPTSFSLA